MMHRAFGLVQELPTAPTEATAKSYASLGGLVVGISVCHRILCSLVAVRRTDDFWAVVAVSTRRLAAR